jgi:hypothetical protein
MPLELAKETTCGRPYRTTRGAGPSDRLTNLATGFRSIGRGRAHIKDVWTCMGDPVGRFENGALTIDVTGFNDEQSSLDSARHPHK